MKINFSGATLFKLAITIVIVIVLWLAYRWEKDLYRDILDDPRFSELSEAKQQEQLERYACYKAEEEVGWRPLILRIAIVMVVITYIIHQFTGKFSWNMTAVIALAIYAIEYMWKEYRIAHLYLEMCNKIDT